VTDRCVVIRREPAAGGAATGLDYVVGISEATAGARGLCLQLVTIPPGARANAHLHDEHESAAYVLSGEVVTWFGDGLAEHVVAREGDFVYIPSGVPHLPVNYGSTPATALVARTDPREQESVRALPELDGLPHLAAAPADLL
jgi:uncharacterized RmlC-like cupin family protein